MTKFSLGTITLLSLFFGAPPIWAQKQEIAGSLSALLGTDRASRNGTPFNLSADYALGLDYEYRFLHAGPISLYGGLDFVASQSRKLSSPNSTLTRDVATIYLTPNVLLKVHPFGRFEPWVTAGYGVSIYEQSVFQINNAANPALRDVTHGAFMYGGGVDVPIFKSIALRGQIRDFYSGSPAYNIPVSGGQHNVLAGGALVFRWGK